MIQDAIQERIARVIGFDFAGEYRLHLRFDDGEERLIDFEPILVGPIFGPLHDPEHFKEARFEPVFGTIEWPNGADIDPSVLYNWDEHVAAIVERRRAISLTS